MKSIIDLGSVLLFDRSRVASPYVRLLVSAIGQELARGSPWVSVNKRALAVYALGPYRHLGCQWCLEVEVSGSKH